MGQIGGPERILEDITTKTQGSVTLRLLTAIGLLVSALCSPLSAATVSTAQDLTAVIALQGKPCGKVVKHDKLGDNEFLAHCSSGDVYRVYVDPNGRVRVETQK